MRRVAHAVLAAAPPAILIASFTAHPAAPVVIALAVAALPPALVALAMRPRPGEPLAVVVAALWLLLSASLVAILALDGRPAGGPLGLPPGTVVALLGLGVAPLVLISWAHARWFRPPAAEDA